MSDVEDDFFDCFQQKVFLPGESNLELKYMKPPVPPSVETRLLALEEHVEFLMSNYKPPAKRRRKCKEPTISSETETLIKP